MHDVRWPLLRRLLVEDGWSWREETLYAPRETLWFTTCDDAPELRDRLSEAPEAVDQADLQADLFSLVSALDTVLRGN